MTIVIDSTIIGTQPDGLVLRFYVGRCSECVGISAMRFERRDILAWGAAHEGAAHPGLDGARRRRDRTV